MGWLGACLGHAWGPAVFAAPILLLPLLDAAYPRHGGLLLAVHPVATGFRAARALASRLPDSLAAGAAVWLAVVSAHMAAWGGLVCAAALLGPAAWLAASASVLKFSAALRLLLDHALRAAACIEEGDLDCARREVGEIVRRPTGGLGAAHLASAAIESIAENLVDGYTGPLTYYPPLGPLGALLHRMANTMDAALGYRRPGLYRLGAPSAHADTVLAYVPARATALLAVLLAPLAGGSARGALRAWLEWRGATPSVNAGHPIAAFAGALGVRLEKPGAYTVNPHGRPPGPGDVRRAARLAVLVAAAYTAAAAAASAALARLI